MRHESPKHRDLIVGLLADRQHGVVSRAQLLDEGLSARAIARMVESGRLRIIFRGVYAVGHTRLRREGYWMAALLAAGDDAVLSHFTAAALWRLCNVAMFPIHVTTSGDGGRKQRDLVVHRQQLPPDSTIKIDGLRTTTPACTIALLAGSLSARELRKTVEKAQDVNRFRPDEIERHLTRMPKARGRRVLNDLLPLMTPDSDNARSHLERLFLKLTRSARLPEPDVNAVIAGRRRDFSWPAHRLVVETDGYAYHSSREARTRDARRDRELLAAGWRPARFTYEEIALEPEFVNAEVAVLLGAPRGAYSSSSSS
jgi:very-short-patch-repair endonuclease